MRLKPGGVREMHWHQAAEWAYMLKGKARITAIDQDGRAFQDDVGEGDLWYFAAGIPHSIQGLEGVPEEPFRHNGWSGSELTSLRRPDDGRRFVLKRTSWAIDWIARSTRDHPDLQVGASPRAVEHMGDATRAWALLDGRDYVLPDDVKELAGPVLAHRLVPTTDARIRGRAAEELLAEVIEQVEVPVEFETGMAQASE